MSRSEWWPSSVLELPAAIPMGQIIAAVVAGNGVLCKTSDFTPECGELIGKLFRDAGFPEDLVTIVQGGGEVGQALIDARPIKCFSRGAFLPGGTLQRLARRC